MNEPAPNLLDARPDVPAAIVELYFRMMEKHPDARQQTAQEVADSLAAWLATTVAATGKPSLEVPQRPSLRRSATAGAPPRRTGDSDAPRAATAPAAPVMRSGTDSGSGGGAGSGSGSGSGIGKAPQSAVDLHSLALTPPPSSGSNSTGRFPAVSPTVADPSNEAAGIVINTSSHPLPGSGRASVGDIRRPTAPVPAANRGTPGPATPRGSWLSRRYAGLPLAVWLAGWLLLAVTLLVGGWFWFGSSGQPTQGDEVQGKAELPADADGSAAEEPVVESKPRPDSKKKLPPKPTSRPPLRNKKAKPTDESSGPSPLDGLDKLGPAPIGE
jgi:hypothetical protein